MKKFMWIATLLAVLVVLAGCPGGGDNIIEEDTDLPKGWFLGVDGPPDEDDEVPTYPYPAKLPDNKKTLEAGTNYVHIFWTPTNRTFQRIRIDFTISQARGVMWQCAWDDKGLWASWNNPNMYMDFTDGSNPAANRTTPVHSMFFEYYGDISPAPSAIDTKTMFALCLTIVGADAGDIFTLTGVSVTGLGQPPLPPDLESLPNGFVKIKGNDVTGIEYGASDKVFYSEDETRLVILGEEKTNWESKLMREFHAEIKFDSAINLSDCSEVTINWNTDVANVPPHDFFIISMLTSDGKQVDMSNQNLTNPMTFGFVADRIDWWGGAEFINTSRLITSIKIFTDFEAAVNKFSELYITGIEFGGSKIEGGGDIGNIVEIGIDFSLFTDTAVGVIQSGVAVWTGTEELWGSLDKFGDGFDASAYIGFRFEYNVSHVATFAIDDGGGTAFGTNFGNLWNTDGWAECEMIFSELGNLWTGGTGTVKPGSFFKLMIWGGSGGDSKTFQIRNLRGLQIAE